MDAVEKGATIVYGGKRNNNIERGLFYEPTLIVNIKPNMRLVQEEVMRVRIRIRTRLFSLNEMEDVV
jgi:acyl-CoA reductase-like NAD-dependent aldehyde dehydrogenase